MKCAICNKKIEYNFLNKIMGTYIKDSKGKLVPICNECQRKFRSREEILSTLPK